MNRNSLCILQVNTFERWGGAEAIALNLFHAYRERRVDAYLAVGHNMTNASDVLVIAHNEGRGLWYGFWRSVENKLSSFERDRPRVKRMREMAGGLADPGRIFDERRGIETFRFPGTYRILDLPPKRPDLVHAHNLHGDYFDLRALPWISQRVPLVLTLHDAWLLSGHCSHSFDCDRWKTGCGVCPDLTIYPAVRRDLTAYNWKRKGAIYGQSRLHVATPSVWLMRMVEQSMLAPAMVDGCVIPNGVDLTVFKPGNKQGARAALGIAQEGRLLLFVASGIRKNRFKDYRTIRDAIGLLREQYNAPPTMLFVVGESAAPERVGDTEIQFVPFQSNPLMMAQYYQAADIYLHAARSDNFPLAILEALACGTPAVATAVGGIPEQIRSLQLPSTAPEVPTDTDHEATGVLIALGDAHGMAESVVTLLNQDDLYRRVANNAARDARQRFDLNRQCNDYLEWYDAILKSWNGQSLQRSSAEKNWRCPTLNNVPPPPAG